MSRAADRADGGRRIVLTADRTLMGRYPTLLDGMMASVQTTAVPRAIHRGILSPPRRRTESAPAPLGLRKIQAALAAAGIGPDQAAVAAPGELPRVVGPATRVVALSSGDPLGLGMTGTTMVDMLGGRLHTATAFAEACRTLARLRRGRGRKGPLSFTLIAGGPGAWQLANDPAAAARLGVDAIFLGYGEAEAARLLGEPPPPRAPGEMPRILRAGTTPPAGACVIQAPAAMGAVEISRGCGLGCEFCTLAGEAMTHAPVEAIVEECRVNLAAGGALSLISEDLLRYGAEGAIPRPQRLAAMLEAVRALPGLRMLQVDHVNVASVLRCDDADLVELRRLLRPAGGTGQELLWVNLGVESADGALLAANGMEAKLQPAGPQRWAEACGETVLRLEQAGFTPMVSLVMGLPGETPESVRRTLEFVRSLRGRRVTVFPIFLAPVDPGQRPFTRRDMSADHWRLLAESYELNFRWIPRMFADNHRAAGASWLRRGFIQHAGKAQTLLWRAKFALNVPREGARR